MVCIEMHISLFFFPFSLFRIPHTRISIRVNIREIMLFIINLDLRTNCSIVDDDIDIFWDGECICVLRISISERMKTQFQNKQLK